MRKHMLLLLFIPLISGIQNANSVPDFAYSSHSEIIDNATIISHQEWNTLFKNMFQARGALII